MLMIRLWPRTLGGANFGPQETHPGLDRLVRLGWMFRTTRLSEEFMFEQWRADRTTSALFARISPAGEIKLIRRDDEVKGTPDVRIIALCPPGDDVSGGANQPPVDS